MSPSDLSRQDVGIRPFEDVGADDAVQPPEGKKESPDKGILAIVRFHLVFGYGFYLDVGCLVNKKRVCRINEIPDEIGPLFLVQVRNKVDCYEMEIIIPVQDALKEKGPDEPYQE